VAKFESARTCLKTLQHLIERLQGAGVTKEFVLGKLEKLLKMPDKTDGHGS